jgi:predicted DNA-binding transcriptional regulator YafY
MRTRELFTLRRRRAATVPVMLLEAWERGVQADLLYRRDGQAELRRVTVAELQYDRAGARVLCWDHVRGDYRTFRLPQIVGVGLVPEPARAEPVAA